MMSALFVYTELYTELCTELLPELCTELFIHIFSFISKRFALMCFQHIKVNFMPNMLHK